MLWQGNVSIHARLNACAKASCSMFMHVIDSSNWHVQVKGRQSGLLLNSIHSVLLVLLFCITVVSSISAVRYIAVDSANYHVFANL